MTTRSIPSIAPTPETRRPAPLESPRRSKWWVLGGAAGVAGALAVWLLSGKSAGSAPPEAVFVTARGPLRISIVETGTVRSEKPIKLTSQLEGQNTILELVAEGTNVKEGDVIAKLDASRLLENEQQQLIAYEKAYAAYVQADKALQIQRNQNESAIKAAELEAEFAKKDLEKYRDGDWPQALQQAQADIMIAEEELKRASDRRDWSETLAAKGFISGSELEADRLAVKKREIDRDLARRKLEVLEQYTHPKDLKQLQAHAEEKENELERVRQRAEAAEAQAQADLNAKRATSDLERVRLDKWKDQIKKATIRAPQAGMVVYATTGEGGRYGGRNESPIQEGATVRERETIVTLPDLSKMIADTKIHESALDRVREGQDAIVTVDALPKTPFRGRVTRVALLPDVQQSWLNPDLKVYTTEIALVGDTTMLRPGMSCSVEIIVEDLEDALYIPIQSVQTRGRDHFAFVVRRDGSSEERRIEIGRHNDKFVHVASGVAEGERVLLSAPPSREQAKPLPRTGEPATEKPAELPPVPPGAALPEPRVRRPPEDGDAPARAPREGWGDRERMRAPSPEDRERMRGRRGDEGGGGIPRGGDGADRGGR
jgi:HlyD family secretion protein